MELIKTQRDGKKVKVDILDAHVKGVLEKKQYSLPEGATEKDIPEVEEEAVVSKQKLHTPQGLMRLRIDELLKMAKEATKQDFPGSTPKADLVELIINKQEESIETAKKTAKLAKVKEGKEKHEKEKGIEADKLAEEATKEAALPAGR